MLISPKIAIKEGWVTWNEVVTDIEKHIQPNALDFDCARIFRPETYSDAYLSEKTKKIRKYVELTPDADIEGEPAWSLINGQAYDFSSNFHVTLPEGVAAQLIIRSTLNRSGVFLTSGLYDSGFVGQVAGMLRIANGLFFLAPNTRIGQIMFIKSDAGGLYAGGYSHAAGTHYTEAQKPH
jgi:deoxycytidine triphosphate deaminase